MEKRAKVLILGGSGMLGHQVYNYFKTKNKFKVYALGRDKKLNTHILNIKNFLDLEQVIKKMRPQIIINCIGILKDTKLDILKIYNINSNLPKFLESYSSKYGYKIIHISTDCVFSGLKGNYKENDFCDAKDHYGVSKILGEIYSKNVINIRTSIIGLETKKNKRGLLEWFLSQKHVVKGYSLAYFSGLTTLELSFILYKYFVDNEKNLKFFLGSVVHISGPKISKFKLLSKLKLIFDKNIKITNYKKVKIDRSLNSKKFQIQSGYKIKSWNLMLKNYKKQQKDYEII